MMSSFKNKFVVLVQLFFYTVNCRQSFDSEPDDRQINPGEDTTLICRILEKHRNSQCIWQKDGKPVRIQEGKYEWSGTQEWGDCSIKIYSADITYDDGEWRCQVTSSSFNEDDALSSRPARLVVRIPPSDPRIYYNGQFLNRENDLRVRAGERVNLRCESRGGNPAAALKWFLDEDEMSGGDQRNETEVGNAKRWNAIAAIDITLNREHNGKSIKCVALHDAYPRRSMEVMTNLNIMYAPVVRLEREEGVQETEAEVDRVKIRCMAEGNPVPDVLWRKAGGESIFRLGEFLIFDPIRIGDGGTYYCSARNEIGGSDELSVTFDVFYPPKGVRTIPERRAQLEAGEQVSLQCDGSANPPPKFEWQQKMQVLQKSMAEESDMSRRKRDDEKIFLRSEDKFLEFRNISYEQEGQWVCVASNVIKGRERRVQSPALLIEVSGRPQVLISNTTLIQEFVQHSDASIKAVFCSDPKYKTVFWDWGNLNMSEGATEGRFSVPVAIPDPGRTDCFLSRLRISDVISSDSRTYFINVINARGETRQGIQLQVIDPIAMSTMIGVTLSVLLIATMLVVYSVYTYKTRRACFKYRHTPTSVFADQTDTQNFRINYPHEHFGSRSNSVPESVPDPDDDEIELNLSDDRYGPPPGRPVPPDPRPISPVPPPMATSNVSMKRRNWVPAYPLPPKSQFPLGFKGGPTYRSGTNVSPKTPQNLDGRSSSSSSSSTLATSTISSHGNNNNTLSPAIMYAQLSFPNRSGKIRTAPVPSSKIRAAPVPSSKIRAAPVPSSKIRAVPVPSNISRRLFESTERVDL